MTTASAAMATHALAFRPTPSRCARCRGKATVGGRTGARDNQRMQIEGVLDKRSGPRGWSRRDVLAMSAVVGGGLAQTVAPKTESQPGSELNALLQRQTQQLLDALAAGDRAPWQRYVADNVVFLTEDGTRKSKADLIAEVRAFPPELWGRIRVTNFDVVRHDRVAIATYIADEDEGYYGQVIHARYRSTDTWLLTSGAWQMIASQVLALRDDPPSIELPASALEAYVGRYALTPAVSYTITREGASLRGQRTGRKEETLKVEVPDVLFVPGQPRLRKIFKRDSSGRITGFVERRETWDIAWQRVL